MEVKKSEEMFDVCCHLSFQNAISCQKKILNFVKSK